MDEATINNYKDLFKFEDLCLSCIEDKQWRELADHCQRHMGIKDIKDKSRSHFYKGIAFYKMKEYRNAINCFNDAAEIMTSTVSKTGADKFTAQILYNMGLAYFKGFHLSGDYAEECFRRCLISNPKHQQAYKNMAFVKNLGAKYD